jgi:hypothetical protein
MTSIPVVGHTVAEDLGLQLEKMRDMGVNTISLELRATDANCSAVLFRDAAIHSIHLCKPKIPAPHVENFVPGSFFIPRDHSLSSRITHYSPTAKAVDV